MIGIKYISWCAGSGYGDAARHYMLGLRQLGVPLTWTPMVPGRGWGWGFGYVPSTAASVGDPDLDDICNAAIPYDVVIVHLPPEYLPGWGEREPGKMIVSYTTWETSALPPRWPALLNAIARVLVPCKWNLRVFQRSGVTVPVHVVPHSLHPDHAPAAPASGLDKLPVNLPGTDFVFYTINMWTNRKAPFKSLEAYMNTFTGDDPVALVLKTSIHDKTWSRIPFTGRYVLKTRWSVNRMIGRYPNPAKVHLIDNDSLSASQIHAVHKRGDCYISLCRSEGWGMGAFEAAAHGNPVLMTGYGGQLDFLPNDFAYLVDYKLIPVRDAFSNTTYGHGQKWAEPDTAHASRLMRHIFDHPAEARRRGAALARSVNVNYSARTVAQTLLESIS